MQGMTTEQFETANMDRTTGLRCCSADILSAKQAGSLRYMNSSRSANKLLNGFLIQMPVEWTRYTPRPYGVVKGILGG